MFFFKLLEILATKIIDPCTTAISDGWRWFRKGPLRSFFFYLLLVVVGIIVIIEAICEEADRFLANIEKIFISIALLIMVALSFLDYMRREIEFFDFEISGGASMSVMLMVWVGFLGASLATRQKKHLAVDATDRILSPAAAKLAKRFTALLSAGFCWHLAKQSMLMIEENLIKGASQDALPLWESLQAPVNTIGTYLFHSTSNILILLLSTALLLGVVYISRSKRNIALDLIGSALLFTVGISYLSLQWNPIHTKTGNPYEFERFGEEKTAATENRPQTKTQPASEIENIQNLIAEDTGAPAAPKEEPKSEIEKIQELIGEDTGTDVLPPKEEPKSEIEKIQDLIGEDTGEDAKSGAPGTAKNDASKTKKQANPAELLAFLENSAGGDQFPLWLAQSVIPLSFFLMSLRFLALGLSGRFEPDPEEDDDDEKIDSPPPKLKWIQSTGRGTKDLIFVGLFPGLILGLLAAWTGNLGWIILFGAIILVLIGSPLFLSIGVASLACVTLIQGYSAINISKDMYEAVKKEELLAIPFFVLAGNLMTKGTIAERLVGVARAFMGKTPGALGLASIFACVIFAAISGSSPVTVIAVGSIMFPMLVKDRYPENYSLGVLTSAGSLGIIIPPSVPMIIYAIMVSQTLLAVGKEQINPETGLLPGGFTTDVLQLSPNDLFIAGILPGLFIALMLALYTFYQTRPTRKDIDIVVPEFEEGYFPHLLTQIRKSFLSILLPVLILGGIYGVLGPLKFTVTEAAAVAVVYALFVELVIHRELKPKDLPGVLSKSGVMMGSLFLIIVLAIAFNKFLAEQYIPQLATEWIQATVQTKWQFLILVNLFLLALGCVMDIISAILIVSPLLAPIAMSYGIHPLHFGIMFIVNLELGYLTPPLGINLFVSSTVFKRPVIEVIKGTLPFLFLMLFCLAVIVFFPFLSLALV